MWNLFPIDLGQLILIFNAAAADGGNDADDANDGDDANDANDGANDGDDVNDVCDGRPAAPGTPPAPAPLSWLCLTPPRIAPVARHSDLSSLCRYV
tara:strand:- start:108 stop:395 length:288 start_codon:yes stop_codon:yes gene_type:complete